MTIPENEQIDAILTGRLFRLVHRYCDSEWEQLAKEWTVSIDAIREEAVRRGLGVFVAVRPTSEGFWIGETSSGYEVYYFERGIKMCAEGFADLESAFDSWLIGELKVSQLPTNSIAGKVPNPSFKF